MKIEKIKEILHPNQAALIMSDANRKYLTGFSSSAGIVYISKRSALFLIDFRYFEKAKREVTGFDVVLLDSIYKQLNENIDKEKISEILIEADNMNLSDFNLFSSIQTNTSSSSTSVKLGATRQKYSTVEQ